MNRYLNKESYSVYTDAEKCFDLLDLNNGVVELWRCGTDVRDCIMIKRLNERARIDYPLLERPISLNLRTL